ncbi:uncharacterized protein LOC134706088 [Mytilus trossulus]|uniref:uncharacterized protein LOC134706088 n=1 Tax=Mytilus trossulus TaxID=6551 RepID=UPI0030049176
MASSKSVTCGPCKQDKVNTQADIWCNNCDEGLCSTCSSHHKRTESSRDHSTIDIQTYTMIKTECDAHSQKFNLYCPNHLMPCCNECHSKCTGIKSLGSVVEKTKTEKWQESVEKGIISITNFLDEMVNNKSENIRRGEKQSESIKKSVSQIRNEINKYLDNLEEKLCKEVHTVWGQEKSKLTRLITEIEEKTIKLRKMQDDLKKVTERTSKLQSFLGVHQIEQKVHQCQRYVEEIEDSERASEVSIKIKQNGELGKILKELQVIKSFGEVMVVKTEISLKRQTCVSKEAQIELQEKSKIENMTMNIETRIPINVSKHISDIICLMDERVILVEQRGKAYLLTSDGKLEKQLPISGEAWSVSQINLDNIAVTCDDLEGNTLKSIQVENKSPLFHIVYCKDRVIYSDYDGKTVYCVNESGEQIWQHKHDLSGPHGLCVDTYGNIIVADVGSGSVKVISKDGQDSKVLVRKDDLGYTPWHICFNKHKESYGFICDACGNSITRFSLSYD